jgi:excisionase family DNA binding protein
MKSIILTTREELEEILVEVLRQSKDESAPTPTPSDKPQEDPILSMAEAVAYLKLSKNTLYGYTSQGIVPHFKQGKRLLFRKSQLDLWLSGKQRGPQGGNHDKGEAV